MEAWGTEFVGACGTRRRVWCSRSVRCLVACALLSLYPNSSHLFSISFLAFVRLSLSLPCLSFLSVFLSVRHQPSDNHTVQIVCLTLGISNFREKSICLLAPLTYSHVSNSIRLTIRWSQIYCFNKTACFYHHRITTLRIICDFFASLKLQGNIVVRWSEGA